MYVGVEKIHRFAAKYLIPCTAGCGSQNADLPFLPWMGWVLHTALEPKNQIETHVHRVALSICRGLQLRGSKLNVMLQMNKVTNSEN